MFSSYLKSRRQCKFPLSSSTTAWDRIAAFCFSQANDQYWHHHLAMENKRNFNPLKPAVDRAQAHTSQSTIISNIPRDEPSARPGLPPWDRTVDVVYHKYKHGQARPSPSIAFEASLEAFVAQHGRGNSEDHHSSSFLRLPGKIRFLVFRLVLASHGRPTKPIGLNRRYADQDCWEAADFRTLREALWPLQPYLGVSFGFRADVLLTFLSEHAFHATFSPFVDAGLNPLATTWLTKYGPYMRSIILEIDLTRLGLGPDPSAAKLLPGLGHLETLLADFGMSQISRAKSAPLASFVLLCRRFHGQRGDPPETYDPRDCLAGQPSRASSRSDQSQRSDNTVSSNADGASDMSFPDTSDETRVTSPDQSTDPDRCESPGPNPDDSSQLTILSSSSSSSSSSDGATSPPGQDKPSPTGTYENQSFQSVAWSPELPQPFYCPDTHLLLCNHLLHLRGLVDSLRMCGFSDRYTNQFIATVFPGVLEQPAQHHSYRVAPSTLWPRLRGQKSWVDQGQNYIVLDDHDFVPGRPMFPEGLIQLPPPIVHASGATSLPECPSLTQRPRANTISSSASFPSRKSIHSGEESNTSNTLSRVQSDDKSKMQRLLGKYGKGKRRQGY